MFHANDCPKFRFVVWDDDTFSDDYEGEAEWSATGTALDIRCRFIEGLVTFLFAEFVMAKKLVDVWLPLRAGKV